MVASTRSEHRGQSAQLDPGVEGNERLTGITGLLLLLPLAVEGFTILRIGQLISLHMFLGLVLLAPIGLKLASTGYRFAGYYSGRAAYRRKGPPPMPLRPGARRRSEHDRDDGLGSGLDAGRAGRPRSAAADSQGRFIVWVALTAFHVLAHLRGSYASVEAEYLPGAGARSRSPARPGGQS